MRGKEVSFNISGESRGNNGLTSRSDMARRDYLCGPNGAPDKSSFSRTLAPLGASLALPDYNPRFAPILGLP
jgi:hypothetical protein